jgi:hypothetical protein
MLVQIANFARVMRRAPLLVAVLFTMVALTVLGVSSPRHDVPQRPTSAPVSLEPITHRTVAPVATDRPAAADSLPADTIRSSHPAGRPLLLTLPPSVNNQSVDRYVLLRAPTLAGVTDRSLAWITRPYDPGTYTLLLQAKRSGAAADTLVVEVTLK